MIKVINVVKTFDGFRALDGLTMMLLHPLGQPPDGQALVHLREGFRQGLVPLYVEVGVHPPVEAHHVPGGGGVEIVQGPCP